MILKRLRAGLCLCSHMFLVNLSWFFTLSILIIQPLLSVFYFLILVFFSWSVLSTLLNLKFCMNSMWFFIYFCNLLYYDFLPYSSKYIWFLSHNFFFFATTVFLHMRYLTCKNIFRQVWLFVFSRCLGNIAILGGILH